MIREGPRIPASRYLAPPRQLAGTEPLARRPSSFEGGGWCSPSGTATDSSSGNNIISINITSSSNSGNNNNAGNGVVSPTGERDGLGSSGDLSPATALCSLARAVSEQRKVSRGLAMTAEAQAVRQAIIASTASTGGDWHPLVPLNFTLPPHYLPVSPSKMPVAQKRAALEAAAAAAAARGEPLDSAALAAVPLYSQHEPTLRLTRAYCGAQQRVYFEVYPHVYELYKLKSSQDRSAMLKEMLEIVGPPERVVLPFPSTAATGRKPHPCLLVTAEGLRQVALRMRRSAPDIVAVLTRLCTVCAREKAADLLYQAEVVMPEKVVMGQTWQRAWSTDDTSAHAPPAPAPSSGSCVQLQLGADSDGAPASTLLTKRRKTRSAAGRTAPAVTAAAVPPPTPAGPDTCTTHP